MSQINISVLIKWLLAINSVQLWWFITRSSGLMAFLLLWLSTAWGLLVPSKLLDPLLQRTFTFDFHQVLSLLSVGFLFVHGIVLLFDHYLPFSVVQLVVPFTSSYRPLWIGIGIISSYLILLVTVTFYLRKRIGMQAFRAIHFLSLLGYLGGLVHGLYSGTDSPLPAVAWMYKISLLSIVFLTVYWFIVRRQDSRRMASQVVEQP